MPRKFSLDVSLERSEQIATAMFSRRRISLKKILNRYMGLHFTQYQPVMTTDDVWEAGLGEAFVETMNAMSGTWKTKKRVAQPVSIEVRGVAIALDEEISFSYYRYQSLKSSVYSLPILPRLERYEQYCQQNMPQQNGEVEQTVEKALRKRALHDFMQDMLPAVHHIPLIRLSVYDRFSDGEESRCLGSILEHDSERFYLPVADHITRQLDEIDQRFLTCF